MTARGEERPPLPVRAWRGGGKRLVDVVASAAALVVLAPALAVLALLVRLRLGSPVLFRQVRPGLHGEPFTLLKLRTMTDERDPSGALLPDARRLTPFGRWLRSTSLDELPELLNVLRGEMSLVGPRPLLVEYLDLYSPEQARRHEVRPGLTGWAQVNGRNQASWDDKLAMDVWYVDSCSPLLDATIVAATLRSVLARDGISTDDHVTAPRFAGSGGDADPGGLVDPVSGLPWRVPDRTTTRGSPSLPSRHEAVTGEDGEHVGTRAAAPSRPAAIEVRRATDADLPQVLELLQASLGWVPDDQYAAFFEWKHNENPFGRSPAWVAVDGDRIAGFRTWLRWAFVDADRRWSAVRAVDTATHPDYQGRGVFRLLTTTSLEALREDGVDFVFNTPNDQSRPGYLKMGWEEVGTLPVRVRPRSVGGVVRMARSRVAAEKWSLPCDGGVDVTTALRDDEAVRALIAMHGPATRLRTGLDVDVLRWRYGFADLHYRAVMTEDRDGLGFFRVRRRGAATEAVVGHVLAATDELETKVLRRIATVSGADYTLRVSDDAPGRAGFLPLPGQGPVLTWRALVQESMPPLDVWDLCMGDVELF